HPPRLLATMRRHATAVPFGDGAGCQTRASQVDVYVSGHGGGLNHYYDELERLLNKNGAGGARVRHFMPGASDYSSVYHAYRRFGPESTVETLDDLLEVLDFIDV